MKQDISSLVYIRTYEDLDIHQAPTEGAYLIQQSSLDEAIRAVIKIRSEFPFPSYLLPIIWLNEGIVQKQDYLIFYFDAIWTDINHSASQILVSQRETLIKRLQYNSQSNFDSFDLRVLRLSYTSKQSIIPFDYRNSPFGVNYSILCSLVELSQLGWAVDQCEQMVNNSWLSANLKDICYLCPQCSDGFLHSIDHCPKCGSLHLTSQDLIHHFVCGHTAPISDYFQAERLECPKCNRLLKHIGVDYDKPSYIYQCMVCAHHFQQPDIKVHCRNCGESSNPTLLRRLNINQYSITPSGVQLAISGHYPIDSKEIPVGTVSFEIFQFLIRNQQLRGNSSSYGAYSKIYIILNNNNKIKAPTLTKELMANLQSSLKPSDVICQRDVNSFEVFSPLSGVSELSKLLTVWKKTIIPTLFNGVDFDIEFQVENIYDKESFIG